MIVQLVISCHERIDVTLKDTPRQGEMITVVRKWSSRAKRKGKTRRDFRVKDVQWIEGEISPTLYVDEVKS